MRMFRYLLFLAVAAVLATLAIAWFDQGPRPGTISYSDFMTMIDNSPQSIREVTVGTDHAKVERADNSTLLVVLPQNDRVVEDLTNTLLEKHIKLTFDRSSNPSWLLFVANIVPVALIVIVLMLVMQRARTQGVWGVGYPRNQQEGLGPGAGALRQPSESPDTYKE